MTKKGDKTPPVITVTVEIAPTPTSAAKWLNACRTRAKEQAEEKRAA